VVRLNVRGGTYFVDRFHGSELDGHPVTKLNHLISKMGRLRSSELGYLPGSELVHLVPAVGRLYSSELVA
jgi:hypothetical protein